MIATTFDMAMSFPLEVLPELDAPARLGEPERDVGPVTRLVVQVRVRSKFTTTLVFRPLLTRGNERRADSVSTRFQDDIPALEVPDAIRAARIHDVADRKLNETNGPVMVIEGDQHFGRLVTIARKKPVRIARVLFERAVRPEGAAEAYPITAILRTSGSG